MARSSTTGSASAVYWSPNRDPLTAATKFSLAADALEGKAAQVVDAVVDKAVETMQRIVLDKERIKTGAMYESIKAVHSKNAGNGREVGEFGFIDGPGYEVYQERGTRRGITPMHAYAEAYEDAVVELQNLIEETQWYASSKLYLKGRDY